MILRLIRIRKHYKNLKELEKDPRGFTQGIVWETIRTPFVVCLTVLITMSAGFVLGGYLLADLIILRVLFWITLPALVAVAIGFCYISRTYHRITGNLSR